MAMHPEWIAGHSAPEAIYTPHFPNIVVEAKTYGLPNGLEQCLALNNSSLIVFETALS